MLPLDDAMVALFQAPFDDANVTAASIVSGYIAAFDEMIIFAAEVDAINPTTQDLNDRLVNSDIFVTASMTCCLVAICEGMAGKAIADEYATAEDVESDLTTLSNFWDALAERDVDPDIRTQILEIYTRTSIILQDLEVTLPKIITFDSPAVPASVLSYWLYESDSNIEILVALNPDQPPLLFDGPVSVLVT